MLQVKPDKPVCESLIALMRTLDSVAKQLSVRYFVIGATARDILMEHVYGLDTARATRDIDFAVAVSSWEEYERLKTQLAASGRFVAGESAHRLMFGEGAGAYPLDLVPFDGVEKEGAIAWPPTGEFVMNVTGYADAYSSALDVEVEAGFWIKIVSLPAMAVLKILAWADRPDRDKHASDVLLILRNYHQAGQFERLYEDAFDLLEAAAHDLELAGAALLGRDTRRDIVLEAREQVARALGKERQTETFIAQMVRAQRGDIDRAALLLRAFLENIRDE